MLTVSVRDTTIWSNNLASTWSSRSFVRLARLTSLELGSAVPDGWQWQMISAAALQASAFCSSTRGCTVVRSMERWNSSSFPIRRFLVVRNRQAEHLAIAASGPRGRGAPTRTGASRGTEGCARPGAQRDPLARSYTNHPPNRSRKSRRRPPRPQCPPPDRGVSAQIRRARPSPPAHTFVQPGIGHAYSRNSPPRPADPAGAAPHDQPARRPTSTTPASSIEPSAVPSTQSPFHSGLPSRTQRSTPAAVSSASKSSSFARARSRPPRSTPHSRTHAASSRRRHAASRHSRTVFEPARMPVGRSSASAAAYTRRG